MKHLVLTPQKKQLKQLRFPLLTIELSIRLKGMSHHVIKSALLTLRNKVWLFTNCCYALQKSFHCGLNLGFYQVLIIWQNIIYNIYHTTLNMYIIRSLDKFCILIQYVVLSYMKYETQVTVFSIKSFSSKVFRNGRYTHKTVCMVSFKCAA